MQFDFASELIVTLYCLTSCDTFKAKNFQMSQFNVQNVWWFWLLFAFSFVKQSLFKFWTDVVYWIVTIVFEFWTMGSLQKNTWLLKIDACWTQNTIPNSACTTRDDFFIDLTGWWWTADKKDVDNVYVKIWIAVMWSTVWYCTLELFKTGHVMSECH